MTNNTMKSLALAAMMGVAATAAPAAPAAWVRPAVDQSVIEVDWQSPQSLPWRLRNHCGIDRERNLAYCADHCGPGYAVYSCSGGSFGCCRAGFGYCDWRGFVRCAP
jgi:hypothetical protein